MNAAYTTAKSVSQPAPTSGQIVALTREVSADRSATTLPTCWLRALPNAAAPATSTFATTPSLDMPVLPEGDGVLVALSSRPPRVLLDALVRLCASDTRLYLLVCPDFDQTPEWPLHEPPTAPVMLRTVAGLPFSALVAPGGMSATLFFDQSDDAEPSWQVPLDKAQSAALYQVLLRLFWHEALDECWFEDNVLVSRPADARPFDVPLPAASAPVSLCATHAAPALRARAIWLDSSGRLPEVGSPQVIFVPPSGASHTRLAGLLDSGTRLAWAALGLPALSVSHGDGAVRLMSEAWTVDLLLAPHQAHMLSTVLLEAAEQPVWRFAVDQPLASLAGEVWLPGVDSPRVAVREQAIDCGELEAAELDAMGLAAPSLPDPDVLALSATWTWRVQPPHAPKHAKPHPLVQAWQQASDKAKALAATVERELDLALEVAGRVGEDEVARLELSVRRLRMELERLVLVPLAELPGEQSQRCADDLVALAKRAVALREQAEQSERRVREDEERARQMQQFEAMRRQARQRLETLEPEVELLEAELSAVSAELEAARGGGKAADRLAKQDQKARLRKLGDDVANATKELKRRQGQRDQARAVRNATFVFEPVATVPTRSKKGKAAPFAPTEDAGASLVLPALALPSVGSLSSTGEASYLAIDEWHELTRGLEEAQRLSARLVASRRTT